MISEVKTALPFIYSCATVRAVNKCCCHDIFKGIRDIKLAACGKISSCQNYRKL